MVVVTQPLDLWSLFVLQVFGGFWPAVIGLGLVYVFILMMGRMSAYSTIMFMIMFILSMAMGYGYGLITILLSLFVLTRFVYDMVLLVRGKWI